MRDKNEMVREIEERLGSTGSHELAEAMFDAMRANGHIEFDPTLGFAFTPAGCDERLWDAMERELPNA